VPSDFEERLVAAMKRHAEAHPRYGYRRVHALLVRDGWSVNVKRVERLWRAEGLRVPARHGPNGQKALGADENSAWALPAVHLNHVWSYDFVSFRTRNGSKVRILNVVDEFTRIAFPPRVALSIGSNDVIAHLEQLFATHGSPSMIRSDNGREFTAESVQAWLRAKGVEPVFIAKASPQQNCYVERFNGSMRDELLHGEVFHSITEARVLIAQWVEQYNTSRPHRALGMRTPSDFASDFTA
jgi:transposase InsO family protein